MHRLFLCTCVVFLSTGTAIYGFVTSCQTPKNVEVGQTGAINCSFSESIRDKKFIVVRQKPNSTEDEERIVTCYNIKGVRECDVSSGYNLTCTNEPLQTVVIPSVTKQYEGTYVCRLIPSDINDCKSCELKVKEKREANSQNSKLTVPENAATNEKKNMAPEKPDTDQTSPVSPGVIVGSIVGAVCLLGLLAASGIIIRRKRTEGHTSHKILIYSPISPNPAATV